MIVRLRLVYGETKKEDARCQASVPVPVHEEARTGEIAKGRGLGQPWQATERQRGSSR